MTDSASERDQGEKLWLELFLISLASLYLELLVIRWLGTDIRAFAVFKTFPLVTCFVGLGVGCAMGADRLFRFTPLFILLFVMMVKLSDLLNVSQLVLFPTASVNVQWNTIAVFGSNVWLYVAFFMVFLVVLLSGPFLGMVAIGSRLGVLFNRLKPLEAYAINIGGAIAGSIIFSLLAFLGWSTWQLLIPVVVIFLPYTMRHEGAGKWSWAPLIVSLALAVWTPPLKPQGDMKLGEFSGQQTLWSPYQRIDVIPDVVTVTAGGEARPITLGIHIYSNKLEYQMAADLSGQSFRMTDLPADIQDRLIHYRRRYLLPFALKSPKDVLIVGAGSGNDVAEALINGATSVDAVDIDPVILRLGMLHNPRRPYQDPRVRLVCDDARNFFNHCNRKYDLIVFSHLDSHVVTGQGASVRLDNYVYTKDSFQKVLRLLKPDGLMVVSFCTVKDWFKNRLFLTMKEALGYSPLVFTDKRSGWFIPNTFFIAGKPMVDGHVKLPDSEKDVFAEDPMRNVEPVRILTDDWPYLYVVPQAFDAPYLLIVAEMLLLSMVAGRKVLFSGADARSWQLFFLGAAFLLLELQSISRLAQLYGSSWFTSAVVINGVLIMILFANLIVIRAPGLVAREGLLYVVLLATLALSYFLPINGVMDWGAQVGNIGYAIVTFITVLPMFAAGMIFATAFAPVVNPGRALAFNLFGAVVGAMLEYLSNYTGINALVAVAAGLYLFSYLCLRAVSGKPNQS